MDEQKLDAILFFGAGKFSTDVYWLTDWPGGREAYVLFQAGAEPLVIAQLYNHVPMARVLSVIKDVRWAGANTASTMSGILVERGSLLSHSAIVARELGIPAIVAIDDVMEWLETGDLVEMDGATGIVRRENVKT